MVFHPVLENKAVQKWLGDIMPVWTLLDNESFFALQHPPSRDGAAIHLATDLNIEEINQSPIARNAIILLRAGATSPGLKLAATGNLSRKVVADMWDLIDWPGFDKENTLRLCKVINEPDFFPLFFLRHLVDSAGLMKKYKDHHRTTRIGKEALQEKWQGALQALLFDAAFWIANLEYMGRGPLSGWPQHQAGIILWGLSIAAKEWTTPEQLVRQCAIPFEKIGGGLIDHEASAMEGIILRPLVNFGMLEEHKERVGESQYLHVYFYRKTPLFDRFLTFNVSLEGKEKTRH
jgi:hypothetical protein